MIVSAINGANEGNQLVNFLLTIFSAFTCLQMYAWFLMFHLSFFSIAHRIKCLCLLTQMAKLNKKSLDQISSQYPIRKCSYLFNQLSSVCCNLNSIFSFTVLLILTTLMTSCLTALYFIFHDLLFHGSIIHDFVPSTAFVLVMYVFFVFVILQSADLPVQEVKILICKLTTITLCN